MRVFKLWFAAALVLTVATIHPARAAIVPGEWIVTGGYGAMLGGATLRDSSLLQTDNVTPYSAKLTGAGMFSALVCYQLAPSVGLGVEFMQSMETGERIAPPQGDIHSSEINHRLFLAVARYVFMPERAWNPYVIGGAGIDSMAVNVGGLKRYSSWATGPAAVTASLKAPAVLVGAGLERSVAANFIVGGEVGLVGVSSSSSGDISISSQIRPYVSARVGFDFGGLGR